MKRLIAGILLLLVAATLRAGTVENVQELQSGFRLVMIAEPSASSFESIGHFEYLYLKDRKLGMVGEYSIAPGGDFAVYQDVGRDEISLFRRADWKIIILVSKPGAAVKFEWDVKGGYVTIWFRDVKQPSRFPLK